MFKKLYLLAAAGLVAWSCSLVKEDRTDCPFTAPVNVHLAGFSYIQDDLPDTKAQALSQYNGVKVLTLAFYNPDGTEIFKSTQNRETAQNFGEFTTSLPLGSYTMVALGYVLYDDDAVSLTSPTEAEYTVGCVRETFAVTQAVNVTSTEALNLSATLNRIITCLQVVSTDGKTANVNKVRMTFSAGGKAFNPTTGLATVNTGSVSTVGVSAAVGNPSTSTGYVFLQTDEQSMNVTIETLDANGQPIFSQTVNNVPFKRNRRTILTGALYSASASASSFQLNTTWDDDYNKNF